MSYKVLLNKTRILFEKSERKFGKYLSFFLMPIILFSKFIERLYIVWIKLFVPINDNLIVFKSKPDYSDNSRALAEYMIENGYTKKFTICFDILDDTIRLRYKHLPITFFSTTNDYGLQKLKTLKYIYSAKYLFSTHEMILPVQERRKGQLTFRLWHGCGYKDRSSNDNVKTRKFDLALVPGEVFKKTKAHFWNVDEKYILAKGYPRYDWLLIKDSKAKLLLENLCASSSTKTIIWMPTFRTDKNGRINDTNDIDRFPIIHTEKEWELLDNLCFEKHITLFIKLHPNQIDYNIPFNKMKNIISLSNDLFDDNNIPMYKFIALTDGLISDYSSIAIDYLLVDNPIAFTLDDYELYKESRGFVFDNPLEYMPGHHIYNFNDLINYIEDIAQGKDNYKQEREKVGKVTIVQSSHYCLDLLNTLGIIM